MWEDEEFITFLTKIENIKQFLPKKQHINKCLLKFNNVINCEFAIKILNSINILKKYNYIFKKYEYKQRKNYLIINFEFNNIYLNKKIQILNNNKIINMQVIEIGDLIFNKQINDFDLYLIVDNIEFTWIYSKDILNI